MKDDCTVRDWSWHGYNGRIGDHFSWGLRWDGAILQLHGYLAEKYWEQAARRSANVTRIDIAVTVRYDEAQEGVAEDAYLRGKRADEGNPRAPSRSLIVSSGGGSTAYIGNRSSQVFARIYDKWRERNDEQWRNCWRWEVEYKSDLANDCATRLLASPDVPCAIRELVSSHYVRRSMAARWMADGRTMRLNAQRQPSTVASRLCWLSDTCRPVVKRLLASVSILDLLFAVGLDSESIQVYQELPQNQLDGETMD